MLFRKILALIFSALLCTLAAVQGPVAFAQEVSTPMSTIQEDESSLENDEANIAEADTPDVASVQDEPIAEVIDETDPVVEVESSEPSVYYQVHGQSYGWQDERKDGAAVGTTGQGKRIEAIRIHVEGIDASVEYRAHVQRKGWMDWVASGELAGATGTGLRMEAIEIRLTGSEADLYDIEYRAHVQSYGWQGWVRNGATAGTVGKAKRIEAMQIRLVRRPDVRVSYGAHVQRQGWQQEVCDGEVAGTSGRALRMEAITVRLTCARGLSGGIAYRAHVQTYGWMNEVSNGAVAGTTGQSKRVEAVQMHLTGTISESYAIWYRAHVQKVGWTAWGCDGESVGSYGYGLRMEALQVVVLPQGQAPSNSGCNTSVTCVSPLSVAYDTYVQGSGWQAEVADGATSGTTGRSLRIEGIAMHLVGPSVDGEIQYRSHVQGSGWSGWSANGSQSGALGQGLRVEAIQIRLAGNVAKLYDVWYRVHAQGYGWMGWTSNGGGSGTVRMARRVEAIQVKLVRKGGSAPGSTARAYVDNTPSRLVLIGDSRTAAMYDVLYGGDHFDVHTTDSSGITWSARVGMGYKWMSSTGVSRVDGTIGQDSAVVILLGVNDVLYGASFWNKYISYINGKADEWTRRGARVYYGALSPVGYHTGDNTAKDIGGTVSNNGNLAAWNAAMKEGLSSKVIYLDTYGAIASNYRTSDGFHYDRDTCLRLFHYIESHAV